MIKLIKLCLLVLLSYSAYASTMVTGHFEATQSCPAYLSKNTKSNPDQSMTLIGQTYPLKEINKAQPNWVRIELADHHLRWISATCGIVRYEERKPTNCNTAGMADSYVLAVSSQAGFCETYGFEAGKPECISLSKFSYEAKHLTLHGLWPNKDACGQRYGYCNGSPKANHCDYPPLNLSSDVNAQLKRIMPSFAHGSCLERHEWNKHGSCQFLSEDDYFTLAIHLTAEVDESALGQFITEHKGEVVELSALQTAIADSFGKNNMGKVYLGCKNNVLVDIFIQLPASINYNEPLTSLVARAPDNPTHHSCGHFVMISDFNQELAL